MTDNFPETVDIFGWLADRTGCGTIRMMQPMDTLEDMTGRTVLYNEKLKTTGFMPKVLVGQRVCKNGPTALWQHVASNEHRPKLVFEIDDDLWNIDPTNVSAYNWFINGWDVGAREHHNVPENLKANIQASDRVTVTTRALADIVRQWNDDVRIIPNYIPGWVLEWERPRTEQVTVGWMGSQTHTMDWDEAAQPVRRFLERNPEVRFHLMGGNYGSWFRLPEKQVHITPWINGVENVWRSIDFDIALAPLRPHLFNRSKSHLKALEAAALGIPVVASDCGPYPDFVEHGKTGFLVKRDHEWGKYLRELVNDEAMREEMGAAAKEKARQHVLEDHINEWADALTEW
jgi:glycosyltransferase involved in cell wall biosynthesis